MPDPDTPTALCRRLKASDRAAFEAVFRRYRPALVRYAASIVSEGSLAHDLVQDVFVSLWHLRERLDADQSLEAYLFRMTRNRAYRHLRDTRLHARKHDDLKATLRDRTDTAAGPDAAVDVDALTRQLRRWIAELPARQHEALVLSRYHGLSHREIGEVMGISPRTVNNHLVRALDHLTARVRAFEPTLLQR